MENEIKPEDITPEQREAISKVLSKAKWGILWSMIKFVTLLLSTNSLTILVSIVFLKDIDPDANAVFRTICSFVNIIFSAVYLDGQLKKNSDIVDSRVKEILKK